MRIPRTRVLPQRHRASALASDGPRDRPLTAHVLGAFYLVMAGINIGLATADPSIYREFADEAVIPFVRDGWIDIVMSHPRWWVGLLAAGEVVIGLSFLGTRGWRRAGYASAVAFHLALLLFGWGFLLWVVPALTVLGLGLRHESTNSGTPGGPRTTPPSSDGVRHDHEVLEDAMLSELKLGTPTWRRRPARIPREESGTPP